MATSTKKDMVWVKSTLPTGKKWWQFRKPKYQINRVELPREEAERLVSNVFSMYITYEIEEIKK